jgi:hypothetical protein
VFSVVSILGFDIPREWWVNRKVTKHLSRAQLSAYYSIMTLFGSQSAQTGQSAERCDEISTLRVTQCVRIESMIHPHLSIYGDSHCLVNDLGGLS